MTRKYNLLKNYASKGFLFHGSHKKFQIIKPNKRIQADSRTGRIKAVYATDDPLLAMFLAILAYKKLPIINGKHISMIGWYYDKNNKAKFAISPNFFKYNAFSKGYVYVSKTLNFKPLKKLRHEFYSYKEVKPVKIMKIQPIDFLNLIKPDIYPVEGVREAGFHTEEEIKAMGYG